MIRDYMRKDLANFTPYHSPIKPYEVKIDANENPYPHSPKVIERIKAWADDKDNLTRYPDTDVNVLRSKISDVYKVTKEQVICTVGSDQLIEMLIKIFVEVGETVLVPNPSFSMYSLATILNHGKAVAYELDENYDYDYELIIEAYKKHQPKLVFICTPNNPTGNKASIEGMKKVLDSVKCPVIIDEAYEEFLGESMVEYIDSYPQLLILRTFSKAYGIAGLRIGYGISNEKMIDLVNIAKPPYNVSTFSQDIAGYILDDIDYYKKITHQISQNRDSLVEALRDCEIFEKVFDTTANFILAKVKDEGIIPYLTENKVLVRDYSKGSRLASHIRFSVGTEKENTILIDLIKAYKAK